MNVILVDKEEVSDDSKLMLAGDRAKHIVKVLNSELGDTVKLGIINGRLGSGTIKNIKKKYPFKVYLHTVFDSLPPAKAPVDLLLALPRPIMLKRILSQAATLGVGMIHIVNANRVEKSFWEAGILHQEEYMQHLIHGLEQAIDTVLPKVKLHKRFKPFMEDYFPTIKKGYSHLVYAHPRSKKTLKKLFMNIPDKILLAIGPEGGWVDYELNRFKENGFSGFSIGERILRVDTAVVNIHGRIMTEIAM